MAMTQIQFLIIGAEKAGTTSLFEYLRRHPEIHLPAEKEFSFFSLDRSFDRGWDWYLETVLNKASPDDICGEASVSYMVGTPHRQVFRHEHIAPNIDPQAGPIEDVIPERIRCFLPDVKLICVLRDPVERAYSQYRMAMLNDLESRPFDDVVAHLLEPAALENARMVRTLTNGYIANGEYGRILASYFRIFSRDQIMVIFSNELAAQTSQTVARVSDFLGASIRVLPDNVETRYRTGAVQQRFRALDLYAWQGRLGRVRPARTFWHMLPTQIRSKIARDVGIASYRISLWNRQREQTKEDISALTRQRLIDHFYSDTDALNKLIGTDTPWWIQWTCSH
jgi:hypothetical protein